ncbi:uncharacterized protein DUF2842 [Albidovulum inexpectatum]|uniref:Uncharacterized protein DUF2842 n=2 Tax=Albidovulum inexpectatum TaxID=196587 RepID=A0A2S5JEK6_9RHOB|nr:uncharacterized protein DUF2842 [Albidovulum inexpectatum]
MLPYRTRRRLALLILLVGMPLWIVLSVSAVNWMDARFGRQPIWIEVLIYVALGVVWILPFRSIFRGVGKADPDASVSDDKPE